MGINYVENHQGRRQVCWAGLFVFFLACLSIAVFAPLMIHIVAPAAWAAERDAAFFGFAAGMLIFAISLRRSLSTPVERLPLPAGG